ncbi:MAG: thiolase family protein [Sumerlaeia bacterium]
MNFPEPIALYATTRTAIGKLAGFHAGVEPHRLLASSVAGTLIKANTHETLSLEEANNLSAEILNSIKPDFVDEAIIGNVRNSIGNIARVGVLEAGLPVETPAITVDRQCASSMEAVALAAGKLLTGQANRVLVGGVESASQAPWLYAKTARPYGYFEPQPFRIRMGADRTGDPSMGETAEILADEFSITRDQMDEFAALSHQRAELAISTAAFSADIWPYLGGLHKPFTASQLNDECVRPGTTAAGLANLRPVFRPGTGRVTAANSSPLNDAAISALAVRASDLPEEHRKQAIIVRGVVTVGLDPNRMGLGPALAIPKLLQAFDLSVADIDLFEINEAFAAQVLACLKHLQASGNEVPLEKLNLFGGAIALGHPLGVSGLRIIQTLATALRKNGKKRGIASLCIGGGQGMATLIEIL